jgi:hypothetical protein
VQPSVQRLKRSFAAFSPRSKKTEEKSTAHGYLVQHPGKLNKYHFFVKNKSGILDAKKSFLQIQSRQIPFSTLFRVRSRSP